MSQAEGDGKEVVDMLVAILNGKKVYTCGQAGRRFLNI
jgi:hypothetical protein